jgi:hypothetical protein
MAPATAPTTYTKDVAPVLTWLVTGVHRVHVFGSAGDLDSTKTTGTQPLCPGTWGGANNDECTVTQAGSYTYTLDAYNTAGTRILHRTLTLTIG